MQAHKLAALDFLPPLAQNPEARILQTSAPNLNAFFNPRGPIEIELSRAGLGSFRGSRAHVGLGRTGAPFFRSHGVTVTV